MPTFNKIDMLNCAAGHHDFSDDSDQCHVCGHTQAAASAPTDSIRDAASDMLAALKKAESFISGFEGDELQEGIADLLAGIRAAIAKAEGRA